MHFTTIEDVIADDHFQSWYFKTDEEKAGQWENWLGANPQYQNLVQESIDWLNAHRLQEKELPAEQVNAAWQKLSDKISAPVVEMNRRRSRWWIPAAAAVLFLVAGFVYWSRINQKTTLNSAYGSIQEYKLPDGTHVTLNAHSEITLNKEWKGGSDREVWLKGEAFFKVQKTPNKDRFIVHASSMDIIVTGTQFNVISRDDEASVLLTEGSVTIKTPDGKEVKMKPGDFVKIENKVPAMQPVDQQRVLAWKEAKLSFDNTPIYEVAKVIARHYGIKVSVPDKKVGESTISGIMPNDNLDVLIQALEAIDYKITRTNNEIIISGP